MAVVIRSGVDFDNVADVYRQDERVLIANVLEQESAYRLSRHVAAVDFGKAFFVGGMPRQATSSDFLALPAAQKQGLLEEVYALAAKGTGYWYGRSPVSEQSEGVVGEYFNWLNSEKTIEFVRRVTGLPELTSASAQLTRFMPGDFLTRHIDTNLDEGRKVAYVLQLTERWHPDWGGLLQFFHLNGVPRDAWTPHYNSLALFSVKHVHSVTCISPFAPSPRLAISGWFSAA